MTTSTEIEHLSVEERKALGKQLRASAAPTSHAGWKPAADRPIPWRCSKSRPRRDRLDETLPGPFEYDVKRMSASFRIAGRNDGFTNADTRAATLASVRAYRKAMAGFAQMGTMDVWYARLSEQDLLMALKNLARTGKGAEKKEAKRGEKGTRQIVSKARTRDSLQALSKLA
jgi:hypothetical protein